MAAADSSGRHSSADAVPCPDPSAHEHRNKLSEQASAAALLATHSDRGSDRGHSRNESHDNVLGPDGKLSSKSAATSLKYAKATDLPSFPSTGNAQGSAGKAAMLAKDYKMKELWQPEQSMAGSKAAVLAAGKGGKLDLWQASATPEGQSAATLAFRNKGLSPQAYGGNTPDDKSKALLAATMSVNKGRRRAESTPSQPPQLYPDQANSGKNALNAASVSHRQSVRSPAGGAGWDSEANQAARVTHLGENVSGKMFTGNPDWQYEEDKHQAALRASAISMAQGLLANQNRSAMEQDPDGSDLAGARTAARNQAVAHPDVKQEALQYISLQDQAHTLAAERLAKIDKDLEAKKFREYYGYEDKPKRLSSRMSLRSAGPERGRGRRRAGSEGAGGRYDSDTDSDDERQAGRIRAQMASLNTDVSKVDAKKQRDDRAKVMAAAEKRVSARLNDMDSKVYRDTGKVSPAMMAEWESKARERAEKEREQRAANPGKMHIGGGKFMDQSEVEAIAAARLKPTLDEIDATAAGKRQRDEDLRIQRDREQTERMEERIRQQQEKDRQKAIKNDLKDSARREKAEERARKDQEKAEERARKDEEKRVAQEEKRKSRDMKRDTIASSTGVVAAGRTSDVRTSDVKSEEEPRNETVATDGREKHKSALARLKDKFRTSGTHEKKADQDESPYAATAGIPVIDDTATKSESAEHPPRTMGDLEKSTEPKSSHTGAAVAAGVAGGVATGATIAEISDKDAPTQPLDAQQAAHAVEEDEQPTVATSTTDDVSPLTSSAAHTQAVTSVPAINVTDSPHEAEWKAGGGAATATGAAAAITHVDSDYSDDEETKASSSKPARPAFQQTGSMTGYQNDAVPAAGGTGEMPNLERHISQIPESDFSSEELSDDEDWNDERKSRNAGAVTVNPPASENAASEQQRTGETREHPPRSMADLEGGNTTGGLWTTPTIISNEQVREEQKQDSTAPPVAGALNHPLVTKDDIRALDTESESTQPTEPTTDLNHPLITEANITAPRTSTEPPHPADVVHEETATRLEEQRAEPPRDLDSALQTPDVPRDTSGPDSASMVAIPPASVQNSPTAGNKLSKKPKGEENLPAAVGAPVAASDSSTTKHEEKPAVASTSKHEKVSKEAEKKGKDKDKEEKGVRGFFHKLRAKSRSEKSGSGAAVVDKQEESKGVPYESHKAGEKPKTGGIPDTSSAVAGSTLPPVDVGPKFDANESEPTHTTDVSSSDATTKPTAGKSVSKAEPDSPSSFQRGDVSRNDPDDVSSSGADEDDVQRGRGGRVARKLGFHHPSGEKVRDGKLHKPDPRASEEKGSSDLARQTSSNDEDQFEEARDHFDETLAPPPAFGGQKKSESPVRETRFKEDV